MDNFPFSSLKKRLIRIIIGILLLCISVLGYFTIRILRPIPAEIPEDTYNIGVVFGASIYASGRLSDALLQRTNTAIQLYKRKRIRKLYFTGSDMGYPKIGEAAAMSIHAERHGVPKEDIILDRKGDNTLRSLLHLKKNVKHLSKINQRKIHFVFISHAYHLARIKLICRTLGISGSYLAARGLPLTKRAYYILREVFAYLFTSIILWEY